MLKISNQVTIPASEIRITAVRAQGAGGQHVNKVASAVHLRFDIRASSLPEYCKEGLLALNDQRISGDGCVIIKAQQHRSQERNREEALRRLRELIRMVAVSRKKRIASRPSAGSRRRRLEDKQRRGAVKALRGKLF